MKRKKTLNTWSMIIIFILTVSTTCLPSASALDKSGGIPAYKEPVNDTEILRREGGDIGNYSVVRSLTRSLTRGESRSLTRSLTRGESRSLTRSLTTGEYFEINHLSALDPDGEIIENQNDEDSFFDDEIITLPSILSTLAPVNTGYTAKSQPVLQWYISSPWNGKIEFTLNEYKKIEPVLETFIQGPFEKGIHQINIADYNITLKPDTNYEWFIAIVPFPDERSADLLASAGIKYVKPSTALSGKFTDAAPDQLYSIYAENGYWYDAIENLSRLINEKPDDKIFKIHQAKMLEQVQLGKIAEYLLP